MSIHDWCLNIYMIKHMEEKPLCTAEVQEWHYFVS